MTNQIKNQRDTLLEAVQTFGSPLYFYDANKIVTQIEKMRNAFKGVDLKLKYACKALTNINVIKLMNKHGVDVDVVSIEEAKIALKSGYSPSQIQYTPSGVAFSEIEEAVELGIRMNLDSLQVIEQFGERYGSSKEIGLRVNPSIMGGGNAKISVGHSNSKFGIPYQQFDEVIKLTKKYNLKVIGLHQHTGSDFKNADIIIDAAEVLYELAFNHFPDLEFIDLGSGFKVAYSENDNVTDMETLGRKVVESFNNFITKYGKPLQLWFEPGKFLVSEAGSFLAKVNVVKQTTSTVFAHVDSGFNHLVRPMMYNSYHHITNISNPTGRDRYYSVVGYICETDTFASNRRITEISEEDILCFHNAGAYCFSMASNYNSRYIPAEVMIYKGKDYLIRKRQTIQDILHNQVVVDVSKIEKVEA